MNDEEGYPCPTCERNMETADVWADGKCPYCGRFYTWEDVPTITDDRYANRIEIDRAEYERLKAKDDLA